MKTVRIIEITCNPTGDAIVRHIERSLDTRVSIKTIKYERLLGNRSPVTTDEARQFIIQGTIMTP